MTSEPGGRQERNFSGNIPLVIAGAGGFGREVAWLVAAINEADNRPHFTLRGFLDPSKPSHPLPAPYLGDEAWAEWHLAKETQFVVAVGAPALRRRIATRLEQAGFVPATLVHPRAEVGPSVRLGPGGVVCAGAVLTVDVQVGRHGLLNLNCTVGHDCQLGDFVTLAPGVHLSGATRLGHGVEVGTGAVTLPQVSLADGAILGAGAVLTHDAAKPGTYVGIPARPMASDH